MKDFITKEMLEAVTVDLPESYHVGLSFEREYGGNIVGVNVVVVKAEDSHSTIVYSKYRGVDET